MVGIDFTCPECGREHRGTDGSAEAPWPALSFHRPDPYLALSRHRRRHHAEATADLCWFEDHGGARCFVRARLSLPVVGEPVALEYGLWAEVGEEAFLAYQLGWDDPVGGRSFVGRSGNAIPGYDGVEQVPLLVTTAPFPDRPRLRPDSLFAHPLVRDVLRGITRAEAELRIRTFGMGDPSSGLPGIEV